MLPYSSKYRLVHPENYLFSLSRNILSGSKYPEKIFYLVLKTEALDLMFSSLAVLVRFEMTSRTVALF